MKRAIISLSLPILLIQSSMACTAFCLCSEHRAFLGKNLDWPVEEGFILVNRSGVRKSSFQLTDNSISWTALYSSITFNQFGFEFPLGGMNEKGLVVEELNMPAVRTTIDSSKLLVNEFQVVQYMLDNFQSLDEIEGAMAGFQMLPLLLSLHYLIMDRHGDSMIMEFDGSQFTFHHSGETGIPVLSNNLYRESIRYLKKFKGFGGDLAIQHRSGSNERFVSAASMLQAGKDETTISRSFAILDTVSQADTKWSIIYDATSLTIYLKFHKCAGMQQIKLKQVLALDPHTTLGVRVSDCKLLFPQSWKPFSPEENRELINRVVMALEGEMDLVSREELFDRMLRYSKGYIIRKQF